MTDTTIEQAVEDVAVAAEEVAEEEVLQAAVMHYRKRDFFGDIESHGGATICVYTMEDGLVDGKEMGSVKPQTLKLVSFAACSNDDNFDRKKGVKIAMDRLASDNVLVATDYDIETVFSAISSTYSDIGAKPPMAEIFLKTMITLYRLNLVAGPEAFDVSALDFISRELGMGGLGK